MPKRATTSKAKPAYAIASVDHALRLAAILQMEERITVSEAASRLGVAPSTAHRLLAMLVYRDFAVHEDRAYRVGPVLSMASSSHSSIAQLREVALPHIEQLSQQFDETANVAVRTGTTLRFVATHQGQQVLRVGDRAGMVFPAHRVSGGLALLAELTDEEIVELYEHDTHAADEDKPDIEVILSRVRGVRSQGFALNTGWSERGVLAVGHVVRDASGTAIAALSVSMPESRFEPILLRPLVGALRQAARAIERDLARVQDAVGA